MKKSLRINFVGLILCLLAVPAFAQTNAEIERELVAAIKEVQRYSNYGENYDDEKLSKANEVFAGKILKYAKQPQTLAYKFDELAKYLSVAHSEDGNFRVFSWDTEDGGTMHNYATVYQYRGADGKVYAKSRELTEGDAGSFAYDVFTLNTKRGKVYLVCTTFAASTNDHYQTIRLYKINGATLDDSVKLIKTQSGLTDSLGFEYNFFSVADRAERPIKLISFDKKTNTIKIPVVIEDEEFPNGRVTNKFISYRFNGTYFVKAKR